MKKSKLLTLFLATILVLFSMTPVVLADSQYKSVNITVDGEKLDVDGYLVQGSTVVPLRAIFERLNATVEWDGTTKTVTATKGETIIKLTLNQKVAYVNGKEVSLAAPAMLINGKTFVPLRFVSEALGANVGWDSATSTAVITTSSGDCTISAGQVHSGIIDPNGETWGVCGSPHYVKEDFMVEGATSPILTIEKGAVVRFEKGASIIVGLNAPGGLIIDGTDELAKIGEEVKPSVVLTADSAGPQAGYWKGIQFYDQTIRDKAIIKGARIEYAGSNNYYGGAIYMEGYDNIVEVSLQDVEIKNSLYAGLHMYGNARLKNDSQNLRIAGTKMSDQDGGFPIVTGLLGSNSLPKAFGNLPWSVEKQPWARFVDNDINAVNVNTDDGLDQITSNTTWRNVGVPYAFSNSVHVGGNSTPTLTIEPGVVTLWAADAYLNIGDRGPGNLIADASAKPEGGGEWLTEDPWHTLTSNEGISKTWPENYLKNLKLQVDQSVLTDILRWNAKINGVADSESIDDWNLMGSKEVDNVPTLNKSIVTMANASTISPEGYPLLGANKTIIFGAWSNSPNRGFWQGIHFFNQTGTRTKLNGVVVAYGGNDYNYEGAIYAESPDKPMTLLISNSIITKSSNNAVQLWGNIKFHPESTGNIIIDNEKPITLDANSVGSIPKNNTFAGNDSDFIHVYGSSEIVSESQTWSKHDVPYYILESIFVEGTKRPVLTIEPGTKLFFNQGSSLNIGSYDSVGSLYAVGTADNRITFTSELGRPGTWEGIVFGESAGNNNKLEYVAVEYAENGITLYADLGPIIKNSTFKGNLMAIYRGWYYDEDPGTDFLTGLGNLFLGNKEDQSN